MRDSKRIKPTLEAIEAYWRLVPDLRLGQLICNLAGQGNDVYFVEDNQVELTAIRSLPEGTSVHVTNLIENSITTEEYREYDIVGRDEPYRIDNPVTLFVRPGGTTHRVLDKNGVVHCIPFGGNSGTVLRWKNIDPDTPCEF